MATRRTERKKEPEAIGIQPEGNRLSELYRDRPETQGLARRSSSRPWGPEVYKGSFAIEICTAMQVDRERESQTRTIPESGEDTEKVRILQTVEEIEEVCGFWASCPGTRDSDIDLLLVECCTGSEGRGPYVLALHRDGKPVALISASLVRGRLVFGVGYLHLFAPLANVMDTAIRELMRWLIDRSGLTQKAQRIWRQALVAGGISRASATGARPESAGSACLSGNELNQKIGQRWS